jgi:hypothetical protein
MEKLIRLYRDFQPALLAQRLRADEHVKFSAAGTTPDSAGNYSLRAAGDAETYKFTLNSDGSPSKVVFESASGLGSGLEVVYADYVDVGSLRCPRTLTIRFADQAQHGIELRFDDIKSAPKLSDKDLHW